MTIWLWQFPAADFADWLALVGESECRSHGDYLTLIAAIQADQERQGMAVGRVKMTVAEMRDALTENGMENTSGNRAAVIALRGASLQA